MRLVVIALFLIVAGLVALGACLLIWGKRPATTASHKKHSFTTYVAGATYRKFPSLARPGQKVKLIRDPENPHDSNAIEVWAGGLQMGFIPRHAAANMAPMMDGGNWAHKARVEALFGNLGIRLRITFYKKEGN